MGGFTAKKDDEFYTLYEDMANKLTQYKEHIMVTYQIRINDGLYESSPELEQAEFLYNTVDKTCLKSYQGETKTLVKVLDGKEEILKKGIIKNPRKGIRF